MLEYPKIPTMFLRDISVKHGPVHVEVWSSLELEYLRDTPWMFTEKVDGTNVRIQWKDRKITFGGRTETAQLPVRLLNYLNETFLPMEEHFERVFESSEATLFGEGYGGRIQGAQKTYGGDERFVLFDVNIGGWWLRRRDMLDVASRLGVSTAPPVAFGPLLFGAQIVARGLQSKLGPCEAEGIVATPLVELHTRTGERIRCKIKARDFAAVETAILQRFKDRQGLQLSTREREEIARLEAELAGDLAAGRLVAMGAGWEDRS